MPYILRGQGSLNGQALFQPSVLGLQLPDQFDELPALIAELDEFLHFRSPDERLNVVNVITRPLWKFVNPLV
jgi:hypothetical protein